MRENKIMAAFFVKVFCVLFLSMGSASILASNGDAYSERLRVEGVFGLCEAIGRHNSFSPVYTDLYYEGKSDLDESRSAILIGREVIRRINELEGQIRKLDRSEFLSSIRLLYSGIQGIQQGKGYRNLVLATALRGVVLRMLLERVVSGEIAEEDARLLVHQLTELELGPHQMVAYLDQDTGVHRRGEKEIALGSV